jgi:hypothetical protein
VLQQETSAGLRTDIIDGIRGAITMVSHIGAQVESVDEMFEEGFKNINREFGIQEEMSD